MASSQEQVSNIRISASLIEHYLDLEHAPVSGQITGRFLAIQDTRAVPPMTHLLTVDPDGRLLHFRPDAKSPSGWSKTSTTVQPPSLARSTAIANLRAFFCNGMLNVLVGFPNSQVYFPGFQVVKLPFVTTWIVAQHDGSWQPVDLTGDAASVMSTASASSFVTIGGTPYVFGAQFQLPEKGFDQLKVVQFVLNFVPDAGEWRVANMPDAVQTVTEFGQPSDSPYPADFVPGPVEDSLFHFAYFNATSGPKLESYTIEQPGTDQTSLVSVSGTALSGHFRKPLITLPGEQGRAAVLLITPDQALLLLTDFDKPKYISMTGAGGQPASVSDACVCLDGCGRLAIFAIDCTDNRLWVLRQAEPYATQLRFGQWVKLGDKVEAITCPREVEGGAELFMVDEHLNVFQLAQSLKDTVWSTRKVASPSSRGAGTSLLPVSASMMVVTAVDKAGAVVSDTSLSVSADTPTVLIVDGLSYMASPGTPAVIPLDAVGSASIYLQRDELSVPTLTYSAGTATRWCQGDVVETKPGESPVIRVAAVNSRLAGKDPGFPLTPQTLNSAGLLSPHIEPDSSSAKHATAAIHQMGQWMMAHPTGSAGSLNSVHLPVQCWHIDFGEFRGIRFRLLSVKQAQVVASVATPGSWFSDAFGDVVHYFKHAWDELKSLTFRIEKGVAELVINGVTFVVSTARQAAAAAEMVFSRIAEGIKDAFDIIREVVAWLRELFEWDDILKTHNALKAGIRSLSVYLSDQCANASGPIRHFEAKIKGDIATAFAEMQKSLQPGQSFNDYAAGPNEGKSNNILDGRSFHQAHAEHAARCHYVYGNARRHFTPPKSVGAPNKCPPFVTVMNQTWPAAQFTSHSENLWTYTKHQLSDSKHFFEGFFDLAIDALMTALRDFLDFVLTGAADIAIAALDMLASSITGLIALLDHPIDIPIISWLYKEISGDTLTILDLVCLIIAVPATIIGKVILGRAPVTETDLRDIHKLLVWPTMDPSGQGARVREAPNPKLIKTMGNLAAVIYGIEALIMAPLHIVAVTQAGPSPLKAILSSMLVIANLGTKSLGAPWTTFWTERDKWSAGDILGVTLWATSCLPIGLSMVSIYTNWEAIECWSTMGPTLNTGAGVILSGLALATLIVDATEGKPAIKCINNLVPQLNRCFSFLVLLKSRPILVPIIVTALPTADVVFDVASAVTKFGSYED